LVRSLLFLCVLQLNLFALNPLIETQIRSIINESSYDTHHKLIELIFRDEDAFLAEGKADTIKVIKKLKANGLLKLFFKKPQQIEVTFQTGGNASFFIKILRDTLRSIGYYRYFTLEAIRNSSSFIWKIQFKSEYAIDPVVLEEALAKRNCTINSIVRKDAKNWHYSIDIQNANLSLQQLLTDQPTDLKKSLRPYMINVSRGKKLTLHSKSNDAWFPDIAIFDAKMRLLKIYKRKKRTKEIVFYLPKESVYMKVTDSFNQNNLRHGLSLLLEGEK
jgi:hypothetical protein